MSRHIAILLPDLRGGGVERVRLLLAHEWLSQGHRVTFVLARAEGELLGEVPDGATIHSLGARQFRQMPLRLTRWLSQARPDVLLAAMWPGTGIACIANRLAGSPSTVIVSEHNDLRHTPAIGRREKRLLRLFGRTIYRQARGIVAISEGVADSLVALTGVARERITVINNPIRSPSADRLSPHDPITRWWHGGGRRLIAIGSLKPQKGFDTLIAAVAQLTRADMPVRLLILGEGKERGRLTALTSELGLEENVRLAGFQADPFPFLREAELFVLSSRWEGLGNVITEAMAVGIPVVATDCPSGPAELLDHGRFGTLAAVDDPAALAQAIASELHAPHDPALLQHHAAAFTPSTAAARYLQLATN